MAGVNSSLSSQFTSPVVKAFMDDLFLMSPSLSKTQELLNCASHALSCARMSVKASKSKSLVTDSGKIVHDKSRFCFGCQPPSYSIHCRQPSEAFGESYFRCSIRQV